MGQTNDKQKGSRGTVVNSKTATRFNDAVFIQYELDKVTQAACKSWNCDESHCFEALLNLCDKGYGISIKYDPFSSSHACFCQQKLVDGPNYGYILTGRGSSPYKAIKQMLYKHYEVMTERWEEFAPRKSSMEIDD